MACPPPPPITDNTAELAAVSTAFGTGPTCKTTGGGVSYSALFGLIQGEAGVKNSSGCGAIAKQLSYLNQSNTVSACQINRSSTSSSQSSVVIQSITIKNEPGGLILCDTFNVSNISSIDFRMSVQLESTAQQAIALEANTLVQNLLTAKAESIEGYLATSDGAQVFQAAVTATKNYIQTTNVNDSYSSIFQAGSSNQTIILINAGTITGGACAITNTNMTTLFGAQLMQTLANQSASLQAVTDFNNSFDAYASAQASGLDSLSAGAWAGIAIAILIVIVIIIVVAVLCKTGKCKLPEKKNKKNNDETEKATQKAKENEKASEKEKEQLNKQ